MVEKPILRVIEIAAVGWGLWQLSRFSFDLSLKQKHGKRVGWLCETQGCGQKLTIDNGEFHHIVPVAEARRLGWSQRKIDSDDNCALHCLDHHLDEHEKLGDTGGAAWIRERIRRRDIGYASCRNLLRKKSRQGAGQPVIVSP